MPFGEPGTVPSGLKVFGGGDAPIPIKKGYPRTQANCYQENIQRGAEVWLRLHKKYLWFIVHYTYLLIRGRSSNTLGTGNPKFLFPLFASMVKIAVSKEF